MSTVFIYNVKNYKNREKPLNEKVYPNFWLVLYVYILYEEYIFNLLSYPMRYSFIYSTH